jgi:hypothetical protein
MYRQKEVDAIKAEEAKQRPSARVLKARYEARKLLCKTCDKLICTSGCVK